MAARRTVVIDTDPGQDDAVAILLALALPDRFAVRAITESLRKEVSDKVRVCMICPGLTESELKESLTVPAIREQARDLYKLAMPAQAVAEAIAYALTQPDSVAVNEIIVRPLAAQAF